MSCYCITEHSRTPAVSSRDVDGRYTPHIRQTRPHTPGALRDIPGSCTVLPLSVVLDSDDLRESADKRIGFLEGLEIQQKHHVRPGSWKGDHSAAYRSYTELAVCRLVTRWRAGGASVSSLINRWRSRFGKESSQLGPAKLHHQTRNICRMTGFHANWYCHYNHTSYTQSQSYIQSQHIHSN